MHLVKDKFTIDTDITRLDVAAIQLFFENDSYWAQTRTREQTDIAIANSICFGLYHGERQVGFARVVSDLATFAYVGDVYVLD